MNNTVINLEVKNIGGISMFSAPLEPDLNLVLGKNGSGKTSLRNAIAYMYMGDVPRGGKRYKSKEWYVSNNGDIAAANGSSLKKDYDGEWNGLGNVMDVLLFDEIPSGDDLYSMLIDLDEFKKILKISKYKGKCSPVDIINVLSDSMYSAKGKSKKIVPKFKTIDDAKDNLWSKVKGLMGYYASLLSNDSASIEKVVKIDHPIRETENDAIADYSVAVDDLINTVKNPSSEDKKDNKADALKALNVFLGMKKFVDEKFKIGGFVVRNGKFIRESDGLGLKYMSRGEKYMLLAELKLYLVEKFYTMIVSVFGNLPVVLFDDFEVLHKESGNKLVERIKKVAVQKKIFTVVFIPKEKNSVTGNINVIDMDSKVSM